MKRLLAWCLGAEDAASPPAPKIETVIAIPPPPVDLDEIPRYPPFAKGLPLATVEQLLASQAELIARLEHELALGLDTDGTPRWSTYVEPVIRRYAAFVHLIPASEAHHHRGSGGLLRHGLEVAFQCMRLSRGVLVGLDRPRAEQLQLEPRFCAAATLAGLLHDAGKAIADVTATDRDGRLTWSPLDADLSDWALAHGLTRYYLHWSSGREAGAHASFNLMALRRLLPLRVERWLATPDRQLYGAFLAALTGVAHRSPLVELVRNADRSSVERDLKTNRVTPLDTAIGVPVDRYLIDAMRRLLHDGRWQVNVPGARVWLLREAGLHLVWPAAAQDLTTLLAQERLPGIPRDPDTIAELLLERGVAVADDDAVGQRPTWRLAPAPLIRADGRPVWLHLLRLSDPALLFPFDVPPAVEMAPAQHEAPVPKPVAEESADTASNPTLIVSEKPEEEGVDSALSPEPSGVSEPSVAESNAAQSPSQDREAAAIAWLRAALNQSASLLEHLDELDAASGEAVIWRDGLYWLRYPDWFANAGWSPQAAAEALSADGLIEPDPSTPMRRVRDHAGARWIVLTAACSEALRLWLDARQPEPPSATAPEAPSATAACPTADRAAPAAAPPRVGVEPLDRPVIEKLIDQLIEQLLGDLCPAEDHDEQLLSRSALQALAKRHGFGVYRLRDALLSDERVSARGLDLVIRRRGGNP